MASPRRVVGNGFTILFAAACSPPDSFLGVFPSAGEWAPFEVRVCPQVDGRPHLETNNPLRFAI